MENDALLFRSFASSAPTRRLDSRLDHNTVHTNPQTSSLQTFTKNKDQSDFFADSSTRSADTSQFESKMGFENIRHLKDFHTHVSVSTLCLVGCIGVLWWPHENLTKGQNYRLLFTNSSVVQSTIIATWFRRGLVV